MRRIIGIERRKHVRRHDLKVVLRYGVIEAKDNAKSNSEDRVVCSAPAEWKKKLGGDYLAHTTPPALIAAVKNVGHLVEVVADSKRVAIHFEDQKGSASELVLGYPELTHLAVMISRAWSGFDGVRDNIEEATWVALPEPKPCDLCDEPASRAVRVDGNGESPFCGKCQEYVNRLRTEGGDRRDDPDMIPPFGRCSPHVPIRLLGDHAFLCQAQHTVAEG